MLGTRETSPQTPKHPGTCKGVRMSPAGAAAIKKGNRKANTDTDRHTDTETDTDRHRDRQTDTHTHTDRHTHTQTHTGEEESKVRLYDAPIRHWHGEEKQTQTPHHGLRLPQAVSF